MAPPVLADSDWSRRDTAISFRELMQVHHDPPHHDVYLSKSPGYPPTATTRTYGGHVFAQSAWSAAHTVPFGLHVHSITGYFLLLGDTRFPFKYVVRRVRTGGVYALRQVDVYQDSDAGDHGRVPCFVALVSFKRDESRKHQDGAKGQRSSFSHQAVDRQYVRKEYRSVLEGRLFEDWPLCQGADGFWDKNMNVDEWKRRGRVFPGLEMRKVDMRAYNKALPPRGGEATDGGRAARQWRLLVMYRYIDDADDKHVSTKQRATAADDHLNLHACAHLYASDRNSLFLGKRALGFQTAAGTMGSLSHTVNIHCSPSELAMLEPATGRCKTFVQESWISNSGGDRVCHNSRIFDFEQGRLLMSTVQDGMMRMSVKSDPDQIDGDEIMRRDHKL